MRVLSLGVLFLWPLSGYGEQLPDKVGDKQLPITCRGKLFALPGVMASGLTASKESLEICMTNPDISHVAFHVKINYSKGFWVSAEEAKSFSIYGTNTYSVECVYSGRDEGRKLQQAPKKYKYIDFDESQPFCVASTTINGRAVRAAFVFDTFVRYRDRAIFEFAPTRTATGEELDPTVRESGCARNYEPDGSPTACFVTYVEEKKACPRYGQTCFDPALAGTWLLQGQGIAQESKQQGPNKLHGWVIYPGGNVRQLAVDFKTGRLVEGDVDSGFSRVVYGCDGELYQASHGFAEGSQGVYCGRYVFDGKSLAISRDKTGGFQHYDPAELGNKLIEPIQFDFVARLADKSFTVPHTGTKLPAYARIKRTSDRQPALVRVTSGRDEFHLYIPDLQQPGRYAGANAGKVVINPDGKAFRTKDDAADLNEIVIDILDLNKGRIVAKFSYAMFEHSSQKQKPKRFEGKFDLPLYIYDQNRTLGGQNITTE